MQRHCENGKTIAHFLKNHPKVGKVIWCGFEDHPNHDIARKTNARLWRYDLFSPLKR